MMMMTMMIIIDCISEYLPQQAAVPVPAYTLYDEYHREYPAAYSLFHVFYATYQSAKSSGDCSGSATESESSLSTSLIHEAFLLCWYCD